MGFICLYTFAVTLFVAVPVFFTVHVNPFVPRNSLLSPSLHSLTYDTFCIIYSD